MKIRILQTGRKKISSYLFLEIIILFFAISILTFIVIDFSNSFNNFYKKNLIKFKLVIQKENSYINFDF